MNSVNLTGRWVADLTSRDVGEKKKAEGRIAVRVSKDVAHFFDVTLWEKTAEVALQYCKKGDLAIVSGRLTQDTWEKDDVKHSKVYVTVDRLDLPPMAKDSGGDEAAKPVTKAAGKPTSKPAPKKDVVEEDDGSDLPF